MFLPQNSPLIAYHNDPAEKAAILAQLAAHRAADELVKGKYWEYGKGCAVGCTIHGNQHSEYERLFAIPRTLAYLEDRLFEGLPNGAAQAWPERFMGAIAPGADLAMVWPRFAHWLMTEEVPPHTKYTRSLASLAEVGGLYREWIDGTKPSDDRWSAAEAAAARAAYAYAAAAAYAAGDSSYERQATKLITLLQSAPIVGASA